MVEKDEEKYKDSSGKWRPVPEQWSVVGEKKKRRGGARAAGGV